MLFSDTYKTIQKPSEGVFMDRGSKFIACTFPIESDADVKELVNLVKAKHPKARHYCWALRLSQDVSVFRVNDDGEPAGSAGRPILNTILSRDLTNILVIVVRYFGGTLLGIPGLINAYKTSTQIALNELAIIEKTINETYFLKFNHCEINEVMKLVKSENLSIKHQTFDTVCSLKIEIRLSKADLILGQLKKIKNLHVTF